ncbi:MAG: riboflavin synthase [Acidobacteria bacterium]|nr:riboflavin synthase [Acidobacteriota bacterium]
MFTGLVEELGTVAKVEPASGRTTLTVAACRVLEGTLVGDSIAVEGACLTVVRQTAGSFTVDLAPETLTRTHLGQLEVGAQVNLERSLAANGRIGGHFVQGHVDGTGVIRERCREGDSLWHTIEVPAQISKWLVPKGYVAVDGISLTIVDVLEDSFTFMLVPFTLEHVTLPGKPLGTRVNIEADILGKYIDRLAGGLIEAVQD